MLPVSATDIIEFRPAAERVKRAAAALAEARAAKPKNPVAIAAAEADLAAAEAAQAQRDPAYRLRVPTIRTKSASTGDLVAECCVTKSNADLIAAMLAEPDRLSSDDAAFLAEIKIDADGHCPDADWPRVHTIARAIPAGARILADRIHSANLARLHSIRHHLILDGERSPLAESSVDRLNRAHPEDILAIADKIDRLMVASEDEAKNSDAP